ncbi:MAG: 30S ribosomal protein S6 [Acidimicrobiia bacterium]|jgi:small subunit ribosomal protein S6
MRDYELMTIHRADLAEDEMAVKIVELEKRLTDQGASIDGRDIWGKRRFAYEIDHMSEGYYTVLTFSADTDTVESLDRALLLADDVVRHKIVRKGN